MNAGKCDNCHQDRPVLFEFRNNLVEPEIRFNLCASCYQKAGVYMRIFVRTPVGIRALVKKIAEQNKPDGFTVQL